MQRPAKRAPRPSPRLEDLELTGSAPEFWQGYRWFQAHRREPLKTHRGKWVAVLDGQVVDADEDDKALYERVWAKFPKRLVYFNIVQERPRVARISTTPSDDFSRAQRWFHRNHARLLETYRGKWVAVLDNQVVDSADDLATLAPRVFSRFGNREVFMEEVLEERRVVRMPGFRVVR